MSLYQHIGVAVAFSPRLLPLLTEAAVRWPRLGKQLTLIHAGEFSEVKEAALHQAMAQAGIPVSTPIQWVTGAPDEAILRAVEQRDIDLLIAGALEKESALRYFLGSVAHNLVREAPCSLLLFTEPSTTPKQFRHIVAVTDYSEGSMVAFLKALRFAEQEGAERLFVVRVVPTFGEAMTISAGGRPLRPDAYEALSLAEEQALLQDFVDAAGHATVDVVPICIEGHTGFVAAQFARDQEADLLVMPSSSHQSHFFEKLFPSDMEWVLREIPCNLWVAREHMRLPR
jgi:nucleotide-binding universal stress UspA family protein